jgi:hypothetical protein
MSINGSLKQLIVGDYEHYEIWIRLCRGTKRERMQILPQKLHANPKAGQFLVSLTKRLTPKKQTYLARIPLFFGVCGIELPNHFIMKMVG